MDNIFVDQDVDFIYSPLATCCGIDAEGNVAPSQQFDATDGSYMPDWTLVYPRLRPWLEVSDPDGIIPAGRVEIANPKWTAYEDGVATAVTEGTRYSLVTTGADAGLLTVRRNALPDHPLTLQFEGEYMDPRTGEVHRVMASRQLLCESVAPMPVLTLDPHGTLGYYPIRETVHDIRVRASLRSGQTEIAASRRRFVWERREGAIWRDIVASPSKLDYDIDISADGTEATIHRDLMGDILELRCRAAYSADGNPSAVTPGADAPTDTLTIARRMPQLTAAIISASQRFKAGTQYIYPEARVRDPHGDITDPELWLSLNWYTSQGNASGSVGYTAQPVATGRAPKISTAQVQRRYGGKLRLGISDRGPLKSITLDDGSILTTDQGIILIHN